MPDAVVTGVGVVSPLGSGLERITRRFAAGEPAPLCEGGMIADDIPLELVPADKRQRLGRLDRLSRLFLSASYLAVDDAELSPERLDSERFGLSFGTGLGCLLTNEEYYRRIVEKGLAAASPQLFAYTVSSAAAGEISIALGIRGPNVTNHVGLAAGAGALGYAADWIRAGKADVVLAGGADVIGPALVEALRDMELLKAPEQARPFADAVPGLCPAEAAVVFLLESDEHARRRGARARARLAGWAAGFEPTLTRRPPARLGITAALRRALDDAEIRPQDIATVFCSAHGTPLDEVECGALRDVFLEHCPALLAPKALHGECFGAGGALAAALAVGLWTFCPEPQRAPLFDLQGAPLPPGAGPRPEERGAALISSLCYSGNCVGLVLAPL